MKESVHTGGEKSFVWSDKDLEKIRNEDTPMRKNFREALKKWDKEKTAIDKVEEKIGDFWPFILALIIVGSIILILKNKGLI